MDEELKRFALRLPADLYADVAELASSDLRSINSEIVALLREAIDARKRQAVLSGRAKVTVGSAGPDLRVSPPPDVPDGSLEDFEQALLKLTEKELEVIHKVLAGAATRAIAREWAVNPSTVRDRLSRAYRKLNVSNYQELEHNWRELQDERARRSAGYTRNAEPA